MFVKNDLAEKIFFSSFLEESEKLKKTVDEGEQRHFSFPDIAQDLFCSFYQFVPEREENLELPSGLQIAKQAFEQVLALPEYKELHQATQGDVFTAGIATDVFSQKILKFLPKIGPKSKEEIEKDIEFLKNLTQNPPPNLQQQLDQLQQKADQIDQIEQQKSQVQVNPDDLRLAMRQTLREASKAVGEAQDTLSGMGWGQEEGQGQQVSLHEKMAMTKRLAQSNKLKEIAELAGRFIRISRKKQQEKSTSTEINNIEMGDCFSRLLPSELMKLKNPLLKKVLFRGLLEKSLLQYQLDGKEKLGKGPIIICVDSSGSMSGTPEVASKGIALALFDLARKERRDYAFIQFASRGQVRKFSSKIEEKVDRLKFLAELEFFYSGGTDFESPLKVAMDLIEDSKFKEADIIFVTDGEADVSPDFMKNYLKVKEEKKFNNFGILMGCGKSILDKMCNDVFFVKDLLGFASEENQSMMDTIFKV